MKKKNALTPPIAKQSHDLIFIDKAAGFTTSQYLEKMGSQKAHHLYKLSPNTTGCLVFAKSARTKQKILKDFASGNIKTKFMFLTDRSPDRGPKNDPKKTKDLHQVYSNNAHTTFERIKRSPFFELWQATPTTGKSHQIRIHAKSLGLHILGDTLYGGTKFPHLCLHSWEIEIPDQPKMISPEPIFFKRLGFLKDKELIEILSAFDRRQRMFGFLQNKKMNLTLLNSRNLIVEQKNQKLVVHWQFAKPPTIKDKQRWDLISRLIQRKLEWID